jgi:radical S-adenosyl methionine domain-containing protein 2
MRGMKRITVNWHLEKDCNYKCKFCYAHFSHINTNLDIDQGFSLIDEIKKNDIYKINFAGGEPLLNKNVGEFIKYSKQLGLKTSIITNGSRMTKKWLTKYGRNLDQIGISCDSLDNRTNTKIGRGFGNHVEITERLLSRINLMNENDGLNIQTKLNTVVLRNNHIEDWNDFIIRNNVKRWKVFKILKIVGENDNVYDKLSINDKQFYNFIDRHRLLNDKGILVKEDNEDMSNSYIMITPDGKFYQNSNNQYIYSDPILDVGFKNAIKQTGFDYDTYEKRGGDYRL